jgi:hypothetical protein
MFYLAKWKLMELIVWYVYTTALYIVHWYNSITRIVIECGADDAWESAKRMKIYKFCWEKTYSFFNM